MCYSRTAHTKNKLCRLPDVLCALADYNCEVSAMTLKMCCFAHFLSLWAKTIAGQQQQKNRIFWIWQQSEKKESLAVNWCTKAIYGQWKDDTNTSPVFWWEANGKKMRLACFNFIINQKAARGFVWSCFVVSSVFGNDSCGSLFNIETVHSISTFIEVNAMCDACWIIPVSKKIHRFKWAASLF